MQTKTNPKIKIMAVSLIIVMFLISLFSSSGIMSDENPGDSGIVDEIAHIPAGYSYLKFADYRLNPEHPPLIKDLAAIPLLFLDLNFPTDIGAWKDEVNGQWESGWKFIYERGNNPEQIFFWSRLLPMALVFLLGFYLFKWTKELFGEKAALFAVFLLAFAPNIITHARYVTTDFGIAVFLFISVYYFTRFIKNPGWFPLIWASVSFALASLAKFSAFLLVPYFALLLLVAIIVRRDDLKDFFSKIKWKKKWGKRTFVYIISGFIILILGHALISVPYIHHTSKMSSELQHELINQSIPQQNGLASTARGVLNKVADMPGGKPLAQYFLGVAMVFNRVGGGNSAFLMGDYRNEGWWYYYPMSFLLKEPLSEIIMIALAVVLGFYAVFKEHKKINLDNENSAKAKAWNRICKHIWMRWDVFVIITVMGMFWLAGLKSTANIGLRWMIPTFPFMYMLIAGGMMKWLRHSHIKEKIIDKSHTLKRFALDSLKYTKTNHATHHRIEKTHISAKILIFAILCVWYFAGTLIAYPNYLSYFNELIGSKDNAYKYTVDSNLDWGQDLNRLAKWVDDQKIDKIYVDYFGGGVPAHSLGANRIIDWHSKNGLPEEGSYLAISATFYQMSEFFARTNGEVSYVRMLGREPDYQVGGSILIYKITKDDLSQFKNVDEVMESAKTKLISNLEKYQSAVADTVNLSIIEVKDITVNSDTETLYETIAKNVQRPAFEIIFSASFKDILGIDYKMIIPVYVDRLEGVVLGI